MISATPDVTQFLQSQPRQRAAIPCEVITAKQLAERWHVSVRWIMDQTRSKVDPLPHFKRGRVKLFLWWDCPDSPLQKWWERHMVEAQ